MKAPLESAVTRKTDSAKERERAKAGIVVFRAYLEDRASLSEALVGATSFFAMTTPFEGGVQAEIRQGVSAADAAKAAGLNLVFTSVARIMGRGRFRRISKPRVRS